MADGPQPLWPTDDPDQPLTPPAARIVWPEPPAPQPLTANAPVLGAPQATPEPATTVASERIGPAHALPRPARARLPMAVALLLVVVLGVAGGAGAGGAVQSLRTVDGVALPAASTTPPVTGWELPPTSTIAPVRAVILLADHPLLAAGVVLPATTCQLPRFRRDVPSLRDYYGALIVCLDAAWHPVLSGGTMPAASPSINLAEHPGNTACGNPEERAGDFTALYCPADETLYLPVDRLKEVDGGRASSHLAIVAHEYGHHVQELSGLLLAASEKLETVGADTPDGRDVSRRIELQANCFAGLFLASIAGRGGVTRGLAEQAVADFRNGGLSDTHGSRAHQASWARAGYQGSAASCNTWAAAPNEVS